MYYKIKRRLLVLFDHTIYNREWKERQFAKLRVFIKRRLRSIKCYWS